MKRGMKPVQVHDCFKEKRKECKKETYNNSNNSNQQHTYHREKHENDLGQYYN